VKSVRRSPAALKYSSALSAVEAATVQFAARGGGRGVLVPGGFILTAAHCIRWSLEGGMALGDDYVEKAKTADGEVLQLSVLAVEPVTDIAVLGSPDAQHIPDAAQKFDEFAARTKPVPVFIGAMEPVITRKKLGSLTMSVPTPFAMPILIYNLDKRWVKGTGTVFKSGQPTVWVETDEEIKGGASGGPIVTLDGELVAIVSNSSCQTGPGDGNGPRILRALPAWIADEIVLADKVFAKKGKT